MAEPVYGRLRRVMMASVEDLADALERAGGKGVMREAIRDVERAIDETRQAQVAANARRIQARRQQGRASEKLVELDDKARYALRVRREDLAEAAVSRQLDLEAEAKRLDAVGAEAASEAAELDTLLAELNDRKARMESDLAAFEAAEREAAAAGGYVGADLRTRERVARAEAAFGRVMGPGAETTRTSGDEAAKLAEIDALKRASTVARRMASLREDWPRT